ncbi:MULTISPECIES: MbtH family NRPS accessory protein [unclassified Bradyrhizobium]|uniref:MbtH family protein n=1 Tax=unclassified Bradyrhizobium TaxID=2631580 RepID=UPI001CD2B365|nr:MbtH family NRPS accessory protein [Bradyrhizobium sp. BRP20]MCA1473124.1 MbtH family NRPS accessory protein [Bradyrhizobium sp. IC3195]MCA1501931.1 MbtH family NRPS accessory protein [Bradyrhizobium sp. NBAIM14]MCA1552336.1 MbtH family NRPS accessory protein [Bradyrhizobium sp. BRP19]
MNRQENQDGQFQVVVNGEEQYSIWPLGREVPSGWQLAPKTGSKEECLTYVEQVWGDMRPASLRGERSPER